MNINHNWKTVNLDKSFTNPVVVAKPSSFNGSQPATVRIRNVTSNSFQVRIQEWGYLDGSHATETVSYLVAESGHHTLDSGLEIEAGKVNTSATGSFTNVGFSSSFSSNPVVFSSVTTFNGGDTVATRNKSVSTSGFEVGMQEQEAKTQYHTTETISYVATEKGSGTMDGSSFETGTTGNNVTDSWQSISFGFGGSTTVQVDEETSGDDEIGHTTENVGYLALDTTPLTFLADMQTTYGGDTANLRYKESGGSPSKVPVEFGEIPNLQEGWHKVNLNKSFDNPVVVAKSLSYNGGNPSTLRIRNVTSSSFQIKVEEWDYLDGPHTTENVAYLVVEEGHHTLSSGTEIEAGAKITNATGNMVPVKFNSSFSSTPVVVTTVTTYNVHDTVTTRNSRIEKDGFKTMMQEQESKNPSHTTETISYVALEAGQGTIGQYDAKFEVGRTGDKVTENFTKVNFGQNFSAMPHFIADMQTTDGGDTAALRWQNRQQNSVSVKVEEGTSNDSETNHITENVGFIAIEGNATATSIGKETGAPSSLKLTGAGVYPNPLTSGNTFRFQAKGSGIEEVKVKVASANGSPVYTSGFVEGTTVSWKPEEKLSNGIYLYQIKAKGTNQVKEGKWRKLLVLR